MSGEGEESGEEVADASKVVAAADSDDEADVAARALP